MLLWLSGLCTRWMVTQIFPHSDQKESLGSRGEACGAVTSHFPASERTGSVFDELKKIAICVANVVP